MLGIKTSTIERAIVQRGKAGLAAIRDRDPEPALLEPYAYGKAGVEVVIDHQDAPHEPSPSPRRTLNAPCLPSLPNGTTFHIIARQFCLANQYTSAFPPQIGGLSALYSV
jgi:hypothetical protein